MADPFVDQNGVATDFDTWQSLQKTLPQEVDEFEVDGNKYRGWKRYKGLGGKAWQYSVELVEGVDSLKRDKRLVYGDDATDIDSKYTVEKVDITAKKVLPEEK